MFFKAKILSAVVFFLVHFSFAQKKNEHHPLFI